MKLLLVLASLLVAAQGQEVILNAPGIIETNKEQCERELLRYQIWDWRIMFPEDVVRNIYNRLLPQIEKAFIGHQDLLQKMDNYSSYQTALPHMRGEGDFTDCRDLCPSTPIRVGGIAIANVSALGNRDVCLIVKPELQNFHYQQCNNKMAAEVPDSRDFEMKYACVPDGFIRRKLIVFCPNAPMGQCREVEVSTPMACSPKLAKCSFTDEYLEKKKREDNLRSQDKATKRNKYLSGLFKIKV
ncbi:uncharacterized protein LOC110453143 [Mizuhopecten yessoensis]|uniref:Uncharacterized protein n=1 Tax=Mizuhopecten yessoensis TaxID=6573 RepID=A0A210R4J4_MIZYE|nr:uncharacterized protein LOC110453143 [Mizuhopecten yessoensis]OWF55970.1 hypothetical protein KP79_PYT06712 [Mizuhopecten yessoensis]